MSDAPRPVTLLRMRRERPRSRAAEERDEFAAVPGSFAPPVPGVPSDYDEMSRRFSWYSVLSMSPLAKTCETLVQHVQRRSVRGPRIAAMVPRAMSSEHHEEEDHQSNCHEQERKYREPPHWVPPI
jgi:hypothetical protein